MDDVSRDVLELLAENARYSDEDIARMVDVDVEEVRRAIEELEEDGVVRGYQAVVDWEKAGDGRVRADVEVNVTLDRETSYDDIAERIAGFPEVRSLKLVSGNYDFAVEVEGESMNMVSNFVSEKVAPIPEITQTVTHFVMETYKEQGIAMEDGHDDDRLSVSP